MKFVNFSKCVADTIFSDICDYRYYVGLVIDKYLLLTKFMLFCHQSIKKLISISAYEQTPKASAIQKQFQIHCGQVCRTQIAFSRTQIRLACCFDPSACAHSALIRTAPDCCLDCAVG